MDKGRIARMPDKLYPPELAGNFLNLAALKKPDPLGFQYEIDNPSAKITDLADSVREDAPIKAGDVRGLIAEMRERINSPKWVNFFGDDMSYREFLAMPERWENARICREIAEEQVLRETDKLTYLPGEIAKICVGMEANLRFGGLTKLTVEIAEQLAKSEKILQLNGLTEMSEEVAGKLAQHQGVSLYLFTSEKINKEVARELAAYQGQSTLRLSLREIEAGVAKEFRGFRKILRLRDLEDLSTEAAAALAEVEMLQLGVPAKFSVAAAEALAATKGDLYLTFMRNNLTAEIARAVARHKGRADLIINGVPHYPRKLILNGVKKIDDVEVARALASNEGTLVLSDFKEITDEAAEILAGKPGELEITNKNMLAKIDKYRRHEK